MLDEITLLPVAWSALAGIKMAIKVPEAPLRGFICSNCFSPDVKLMLTRSRTVQRSDPRGESQPSRWLMPNDEGFNSS